jgi:hypothetical protein
MCLWRSLQFNGQYSFASEPVVIAIGRAEIASKQPQAAVANDGTVHLVYGSGDVIFYCRSTDQGGSFDTPKESFRVANISLGMR